MGLQERIPFIPADHDKMVRQSAISADETKYVRRDLEDRGCMISRHNLALVAVLRKFPRQARGQSLLPVESEPQTISFVENRRTPLIEPPKYRQSVTPFQGLDLRVTILFVTRK